MDTQTFATCWVGEKQIPLVSDPETKDPSSGPQLEEMVA